MIESNEGGMGNPIGGGGAAGSGDGGLDASVSGAGGAGSDAGNTSDAGVASDAGSSGPSLIQRYYQSEPVGAKANLAISVDPSGRTAVTFRNTVDNVSSLYLVVLDEDGVAEPDSPFMVVEDLGLPPVDADVAWIGDTGDLIIVRPLIIGSEQRIVGTIFDASGGEVVAATPIDGDGFPGANAYRYPTIESNADGTLFLAAQDTVNGVEEYLARSATLTDPPLFAESFPAFGVGGALFDVSSDEPAGGLMWTTGPTAISVGLFNSVNGTPNGDPVELDLGGAAYATPQSIDFGSTSNALVTTRGNSGEVLFFQFTDNTVASDSFSAAVTIDDTGHIAGFGLIEGGCDFVSQHNRMGNNGPVGDLFITRDPDCAGSEPGTTDIVTSEPDSLDWPNVMVQVLDVADFRAERSKSGIDRIHIVGSGYNASDEINDIAIYEWDSEEGQIGGVPAE
jgi:hypothetical protein